MIDSHHRVAFLETIIFQLERFREQEYKKEKNPYIKDYTLWGSINMLNSLILLEKNEELI